MRRFIRSLFFFSLPFILLIGVYIVLDPFKVIFSYDRFYDEEGNGVVILNKDYVSTCTFDSYYPTEKYNSFIFGNSRSLVYRVSDWQYYLGEGSSCFHFDAIGESLYGIERKVAYIDKKGAQLKNVLLVLDYQTLKQDQPQSGHLFVTAPQLTNNSNLVAFHGTFLKAFFTPEFLWAYTDFKITGEIKNYMQEEQLLAERMGTHEPKTNESHFDYYEDLIEKGEYYTDERRSVFYPRSATVQYSQIALGTNHKLLLKNIKDVLSKHETNLKIIVNPLYDQKKLDPSDLKYLQDLFGPENVHDFSGINEFTENYQNYYEVSHYRPHVARKILNDVYH